MLLASAAFNLLMSLAVAASPAAQRPSGSGDLFAQIFNRSVVQQRTMRTVRARFTETTASSLLVKPLIAHGTVVAAAPARVRMEYTDPEPKTITMDSTSLVVEWTGRRQRERIDIRDTQKRIDQYFTHANIDQLRSMFEITAAADATLARTDRVEMVPKRKQIRQGLERLDLWIDRDRSVLVQMRMTFAGGDQKTIALDDITINAPVSDELFRTAP